MCIHILPFNKKTIFLFVYYMKLYFNSLKSNNFQNCTNRRIFCQWLEYVITYTGTIVQVIINHCFIPLFIMFKHIIQFILQNGKRVLVLKNILYILKEYTQDVFFHCWPLTYSKGDNFFVDFKHANESSTVHIDSEAIKG